MKVEAQINTAELRQSVNEFLTQLPENPDIAIPGMDGVVPDASLKEKTDSFTAQVADGSGVLVEKGRDQQGSYVDILTNKHVASGPEGSQVEVELPDGTTTTGTIVKSPEGDLSDPRVVDLAKVRVHTDQDYATAELGGEPEVGDTVYQNGRTTGFSQGQMLPDDPDNPNRDFEVRNQFDYKASIGTRPGDSGGPLVNENGDLIGIAGLAAKSLAEGTQPIIGGGKAPEHPDDINNAWFISIDTVRDFLDR